MDGNQIAKLVVYILVINPVKRRVERQVDSLGNAKEFTVAGAGVEMGIITNRLVESLVEVGVNGITTSLPVCGCLLSISYQEPTYVMYQNAWRYMIYNDGTPLKLTPTHRCGYTISEIRNYLVTREINVTHQDIAFKLNGNPNATLKLGPYDITTYLPLTLEKKSFKSGLIIANTI